MKKKEREIQREREREREREIEIEIERKHTCTKIDRSRDIQKKEKWGEREKN